MRIIADPHTHTTYSHGSGTPAENVAAARRAGLRAVAITEHGPASLPWVACSPARLRALGAELRALQAEQPDMAVLWGAEANLVGLDGRLDVPADLIRDLDVLAVGYHPDLIPSTLDAWLLIAPNWVTRRLPCEWAPQWRRRVRAANTKALVEAVARHPVDFITHPGHRVDIDTAELGAACARRGTALEINAGHPQVAESFVRVAHRQGATFVIGSDAHRPEDVGRVQRAVELAERAGLRAERVLNADPEEDGRAAPAPGQEEPRLRRMFCRAADGGRSADEQHTAGDRHRPLRRR